MTDTLCELVPPLPRQVSVNDTVPIAAPTLIVSEPEAGFDPDQAPLAVHAVAPELLQVTVVLAPDSNDIGFADRARVGDTAVVSALEP